jgi:dolichol-phosphate mannosyltransferase
VTPGAVGGDPVANHLLSVVIPVLDEEENVVELAARLTAALEGHIAFEIVFVDDGSTDRTPVILQELHRADGRVKALHLTRNFGHQAAISAGLHAAAGDAVVVMDGDLQDAPEVLPEFVASWQRGYDVVYAVRERRPESWLKRVAYKAFYRLLARLSRIDVPLDSGDFSLMDRRVVDALNAMPERTRFVRGMRSWSGFRQIGVPVARDARHAGRPKYTYRKLVRLALDGFFAFSYRPLQVASGLGLLVSSVAFLLAVFLVFLKIVHGIPLQGWTSLIVTTLFLGGVQLICLGILGEYIGRIYDEVRGRPTFVVAAVTGKTRLGPGVPPAPLS